MTFWKNRNIDAIIDRLIAGIFTSAITYAMIKLLG